MSGVFHVSCLLMKISFDRLSPTSTLYLSRQHLSSIRVILISLKTSQSYNEKQVFFSFLRWKKKSQNKEVNRRLRKSRQLLRQERILVILCPWLAGFACWFSCWINSNKAAICQSGSCGCSIVDTHSAVKCRFHCLRCLFQGKVSRYIYSIWIPGNEECHAENVSNLGQFIFNWNNPKATQALKTACTSSTQHRVEAQ